MRLLTRITIGSETQEFHSSEVTLGTNIYATLLVRSRMHLEVCNRIEQLLRTTDIRQFCFRDGDISIEADEVASPTAIPESISV